MARQRLSPKRRVLQELRKLLGRTRNFLGCLGMDERRGLRDKLVAVIVRKAKEGIDLSQAAEDADILVQVEQWIGEVEAAYRKRREVKPRNQERDREIVRLHDEKHFSFGEIPRQLLLKNPEWCKPGGGPLNKDTVFKAYHRLKDRQADK